MSLTLTPSLVMEVIDRHKRGESQHEIAIAVDVAKRTVSKIVTGESWSRVTGITYVKGPPRSAAIRRGTP